MTTHEQGQGRRRLVLVRHAKTERGEGKPDHERELLPRGEADARAAGAWLADDLGLRPDLVLCSTAARAQQTWQQMAVHPDLADVEVWSDDRIYQAETAGLLEVLAEVPASAAAVVMVGHSPGIPALAEALADPEGSDKEAHDAVADHLPTMGCVVLAPRTTWAKLGDGDAAVVVVEVPRREGH